MGGGNPCRQLPGAGAVTGHFRLVAARSHVAPASLAARRVVDEDLTAAVVGAHPSRRHIVGQEVREGGGDGRSGLVQPVADLRDLVAIAVRADAQLVVVQAVAQDVVQLGELLRLGSAIERDGGRRVVEQAAQVREALEPSLAFVRMAPQAGPLGRATPAAQQVVRPQPVERLDVGDLVMRDPAGVAERVGERDEELFGFGRLRHRLAGHRCLPFMSVTSITRLTSYIVPCTLLDVTMRWHRTSYRQEVIR